MENSKQLFLVKEAGEKLNVTAETLRHYDRIGLVKPTRKENGYRYYTSEQILIISIIKRLQSLGFTLDEVRKMFDLNDLNEVVLNLKRASEKCDEKLKELKDTKIIIEKALAQYSSQVESEKESDFEILDYDDRQILLSQNLTKVNLETLYNYQHNYKVELGKDFSKFHFNDQAGIYI